MKDVLTKYVESKRVLILGFGREGRSTYRLLRKTFPGIRPVIADKNPKLNLGVSDDPKSEQLVLGENYLDAIKDADVVFKSPGVELTGKGIDLNTAKIVSQTSLFLEKYHRQIVGVTGTKGKSTTASLIHHLLNAAKKDALLVGNIGVPPFDAVGHIADKTVVVFEISAHQLEFVQHSPYIAILLNIFQEHLDHFGTFENYARAKLNIGRFQSSADYLIHDPSTALNAYHREIINFRGSPVPVDLSARFYDQKQALLHIPFSETPLDVNVVPLQGHHNLINILFAAAACTLSGLTPKEIEKGLTTFKPLEHRLEFAGEAKGIRFINDSISTIPEATIEAVKTFPQTDTLILGGHDRKIDYSALVDFLLASGVNNFIFTGAAGKRMMTMMEEKQPANKQLFFAETWQEMPEIILRFTGKGSVCLLSPAASSYDRFTNFEERGKFFKEMVATIKNLNNCSADDLK
jgi:UDP-N-acetylmuramoyl-L-alanine---L-glutamate ligase